MKFTKEQALESIKAKFVGKSGKTSQKISDITISDTIESLLSIEGVVTDETELDDFVTKAFRHVDTLNRNIIKEQSDFVKNYNPEPPKEPRDVEVKQPDPPKAPDDKISKEDLKVLFQEMMGASIDPVMQEINALKKEREVTLRNERLSQLTSELKLTNEWRVDFENAMELATLKLGESASAEDVFAEAKAKFNKTLSAKGQTYVPGEGSGGEGKGTSPLKGYVDKVLKEKENAVAKSRGLSEFLGVGEPVSKK